MVLALAGVASLGPHLAILGYQLAGARPPDSLVSSAPCIPLALCSWPRVVTSRQGVCRGQARPHAAELHDIGKVAIPESMIATPGPLDSDVVRVFARVISRELSPEADERSPCQRSQPQPA